MIGLLKNGLLEEAVQHALEAQNLDLAAQLVEDQRIDLLFQEQWLRIQNLLNLFPRDFVERRASLLTLEALLFCYSYNFDALLPTLKQVEYLLAKSDHKMSDQLRLALESELALMWGFVYYWMADGARSLEKLNQAVEIAPTEHDFVDGHGQQYRIIAFQMVGRYREALELAERVHAKTAKYGRSYLARIQISLMVVYLSEGNLQSAKQAAQLALKLTQETGLYTSMSWALQALGYIYYQWNELETARQYYAQALELRDRTTVQAQAQASYGLARTLQALGEKERARGVSKSAVEWANEVGNTRILAEAGAWYDRLAILNGQTPQNLTWAASLDQSYSPMIFIEAAHVSLAAILITQGKPHLLAEAGTLLAGLREFCVQTHNVWHLIEIIALEALLFDALGEHQKALAKLEEAIQHARAGGYIRVFVDLGTPMQALLAELYQKEVAPAVYRPHSEGFSNLNSRHHAG